MGYRVIGQTEQLFRGFGPRRGLEGPFVYANGRILYYDPKVGQYWDPLTDFYVEQQELNELHNQLVNMLSK